MGTRTGAIIPGLPTLVVIHHSAYGGVPDEVLVVNGYDREPVAPSSVLAHVICRGLPGNENSAWLAALGAIADVVNLILQSTHNVYDEAFESVYSERSLSIIRPSFIVQRACPFRATCVSAHRAAEERSISRVVTSAGRFAVMRLRLNSLSVSQPAGSARRENLPQRRTARSWRADIRQRCGLASSRHRT